MDSIKKCCRCHKRLSNDNFLRKNWKGTGQVREWETCNNCNIKKLKDKVDIINKEYNIAYNYIAPYTNNEQ